MLRKPLLLRLAMLCNHLALWLELFNQLGPSVPTLAVASLCYVLFYLSCNYHVRVSTAGCIEGMLLEGYITMAISSLLTMCTGMQERPVLAHHNLQAADCSLLL